MSSPKSETPQTSDKCIIPAKNLKLYLFCDDCRCSFQCRPNFCGFHVCHHISHPASLTNPRGVSESAWLFRWGQWWCWPYYIRRGYGGCQGRRRQGFSPRLGCLHFNSWWYHWSRKLKGPRHMEGNLQQKLGEKKRDRNSQLPFMFAIHKFGLDMFRLI